MSGLTEYFDLNTMTPNDFVQAGVVTQFNDNWEIIDEELYTLQQAIASSAVTGVLADDIFAGSFVLSGLNPTKDGTNSYQLDIAAGVAYVLQANGSLTRYPISAQTFTSSLANVVWYLDFQSAGTFSWATSHSSGTYLPIAQVTTAANGSISGVSDMRKLIPNVGPVNAEYLNGSQSSAFTPIAHVGSGGTAHAAATEALAGFISASDKTNLDALVTEAGTFSSLMTPTATDFTSGINSLLFGYNIAKTGIDANGVYTIVTYTRTNTTRYLVSTLSGGTSPEYTTMTWQFYNAAGTSVVLTHTWTFTYDTYGHISAAGVA